MIDFRLRFFEREDFIALLGNEFRTRCYRRAHPLSIAFFAPFAILSVLCGNFLVDFDSRKNAQQQEKLQENEIRPLTQRLLRLRRGSSG